MPNQKETSVEAKADGTTFNNEEIDLFRIWFCAVKDLNPTYLEENDRVLFTKIMKHLEKIDPEWKGRWNAN